MGDQQEYYSEGGVGVGGGGGGRGPTEGEEELASKMLQIQSKRFYLDVKENQRGRFMKMAEVGTGGRKSRLIMSMAVAAEVGERLKEFVEFHESLPAWDAAAAAAEDGQLRSAVVVRDNRRYYLDLKENNRGRFLRLTEVPTMVSGRNATRHAVHIPADGIQQVLASIQDHLDKYYDPNQEVTGSLPESKSLRADGKIFYFDLGQNNRGVYVRITEVKNTFRSTVTVPESCWGEFRGILAELETQMAALAASTPPADGEEAAANAPEKSESAKAD